MNEDYKNKNTKGKPFSRKEIEYIRDNYANISCREIAKKLNRSMRSIYNKAHSMNLLKSQEFMQSPKSGILCKGHTKGKNTQFKKGHIPHNKGKKMSPELKKRVSHTFFKKGHKPHNTKYDGCISIRKDTRTGRSYFYIRISEGNWKELHRYLYEKHIGAVPKGYNVVFKDNDTSNLNIDNFELISDKELMKRNSFYNYPEEVQKLIHTKSSLSRQIKKITRNE